MSTPVWDSGRVLVSVLAGYCDRCPTLPPKPTLCVQLVDLGRSDITLCRACFHSLMWDTGEAIGRMQRERDGN